MTVARRSFLKTTYLACAGAAVSALAAIGLAYAASGAIAAPLLVLAWAGCAWCASIAAGGMIVLHRETRSRRGRPDLFLALNADRSESALARLGLSGRFRKSALRIFSREPFQVGDIVEIRSWESIRATLDGKGTLDGVPFMREMIPFCGKRARVLRCVDKVYDYGRSKTLRRLRDCVILVGARCDGASHGGCGARCSMFWKTAWLRPARASAQAPATSPVPEGQAAAMPPDQAQEPYVCQYTEVAAASAPMRGWDIRQELRPLFSGNVTLAGFCVALLTRQFNWAQRMRGGIGFPELNNSGLAKTPVANKKIAAADEVGVLGMDAIAATLDATGRNRGLWFDREMLKHCGQKYRVLQRVERIIDDANGRMVPMKTPCIMLDDVVASGEFLRFVAQQEYLFWREAWLRTASEAPAGSGA